MHRLLPYLLCLAILGVACGTAAPPTARPSPSPAGMTLDEEVGAVMMVGFRGAATGAVLHDWTDHQYGGLLIVNLNQNASTAPDMSSVITAIRGVSRHRLIAATDQEGGDVCLAVGTVPCVPMPVGEADTVTMATQLRALGFDVDLGPVSDVCSGPASIMWGRCYGTDAAAVAEAVGPVVDGIHSAHMLAAAKHFPGHGDTSVSSETQLPRIDESLATLRSRNLPPFQAAIAAGADFVLMGHLFYPVIDPQRSADLSPNTFSILRGELGFKGAVISDDMQMGAITSRTPAPEAAVDFLLAGGDMVMIAHDLAVADATFDAIKAAVTSGRLPRSRLDAAVSDLQKLTATR
ncbi:MAG TPA: glycoside hydrolase family 3 N-terminal domain-containing protein [Candidatus Dormibacteraeota bacterium]|nr:glycoside hydrolase family 3 N-terminal domain-containing protein [Candidatus Dormibacteraeota bacterium]